MDKIFLTKADVNKLQQWMNDNGNIVNGDICPLKDVELEFGDGAGMKLKCYRKDTYTNMYISVDGIAKGRLRVSNDGTVIQNKLVYELSDIQLEAIYGVYFGLMNYIAKYKPEKVLKAKESKSVSKHKNSKKKITNTTYLFSSSFSTPRGGHHASPSYSFSVRGHYRHLKDGRTIWVKEHIKGTGTRKEHSYRI